MKVAPRFRPRDAVVAALIVGLLFASSGAFLAATRRVDARLDDAIARLEFLKDFLADVEAAVDDGRGRTTTVREVAADSVEREVVRIERTVIERMRPPDRRPPPVPPPPPGDEDCIEAPVIGCLPLAIPFVLVGLIVRTTTIGRKP